MDDHQRDDSESPLDRILRQAQASDSPRLRGWAGALLDGEGADSGGEKKEIVDRAGKVPA